MKRVLSKHWSFLPTGVLLSVVLIIFWFFNQSYLGGSNDLVSRLLENPVPTFALIIFGAYLGAIASGEFSVKIPLTFEPLVFAAAGGFLAGVGAVIAGMSTNSVVLFNLAGVFTLPAFMITQGWLYVAFMVLGGFAGSRLLLWVLPKIPASKREIPVPQILTSKKNQRIVLISISLIVLVSIFIIFFIPLGIADKIGLIAAILLLTLFGFIVERGTVCMSSMLKEWFISHSAYVWRSVLFTVMCLSLLYWAGLQLNLYEPIVLTDYIQEPAFLVLGSFLMGFGFIFADGCFIGSLWKAGEGNVINVVGIIGLLMGIGGSQVIETFVCKEQPNTSTLLSNHLTSFLNPSVLLIILWLLGVLLLLLLKRKSYRY